jgi:hypothetical protein
MVPALNSVPGEPLPHEQVERFWRDIAESAAAYLRAGHGLTITEAGARAVEAVGTVRGSGGLPDRERALADVLDAALDDLSGGVTAHPRPPLLPVSGLTMHKQPLRPVILAPSPRDQAMRLWSMVAATLLVPGLAAALALI